MPDQYPKQVVLEDSASIRITLMTPADREALAEFVSRLHRHDLAYLQVDITRPEGIERWMDHIERGLATSICAYDPASLVGYASLNRKTADDSVGEIRVNVSQGYRSRGLGRVMIDEIFGLSQRLGLKQVKARMTTDQHGARAAFKHLGFTEESVQEGHIRDDKGINRDLVVMAHTF